MDEYRYKENDMRRFLLTVLVGIFLVNVNIAKSETNYGKIPNTNYTLYEVADKCFAGTAFRLKGDIATKFAFVKEKTRGNSIVIIDPRLAGIDSGEYIAKIIWLFDAGANRTFDVVVSSNGTEDITYYFTADDAAIFPTASSVAFHLGNFLAGFSLDGAVPAVLAVNRCAKGLK